jgi:hypothetical protein
MLIAHPRPSIIPMAVIEKSETGRRAYWCAANCGKIAEGRKIFQNLRFGSRAPGRRGLTGGKTFSKATVTKASAGSSIP